MLMLLKTLIALDGLFAIGLVMFRYALAPQYRYIVSGKVVALALLTPAVALFCGNFYIFCAYLVLVVAFNSRSRAELAANFVFMLPLTPALSQETGVGSVYLFAISAIVAMSAGALIGFLATPGRKSYAQPRADVGMMLIVGIFIFIYNREPSLTGIIRSLTANVLGVAGPYLLISRGLTTRANVERLLLQLSMGATLTAIVAIFQARKHWLLSQTYYEALHVPIPFGTATLSMRAGFLRTGGTVDDPSAAGLFFSAIITLMLMLKPRFTPSGFWIVLSVLTGGVVVTQSRAAWIAAIVGLLFVFAYRKQWGKATLLAVTGVGAEMAVLLFVKSGTLASIVGNTEEATGTVTYRQMLLSQGSGQVVAHPLLGQSPQQLIANLPDLVQGQHIVDFVNAHLFIAMAAGVPMFLIWCWFWLSPVFEAWRHPSRDAEGSDLVAAPAVIIVPTMIALASTSIMDRNLDWPIIAVAMAGSCFALARQRGSAQGTPHQQRVRSRVREPRPIIVPA
jgi:hypothetical protein